MLERNLIAPFKGMGDGSQWGRLQQGQASQPVRNERELSGLINQLECINPQDSMGGDQEIRAGEVG